MVKRWPYLEGVDHLGKPASAPLGRQGYCLLCGANSGPVVISEAGYQGRACACGMVYLDPIPPSGTVDPTYDRHLDDYYSLPARLRLQWVKRFSQKGRLLEVGCGAGHFLSAAKTSGYEVFAIEPHPECARHVAESLGIQVERALVEETAQPKGYFDIVFHIDLLSHFPDPVRALRAMAALLRPGGMLCFEIGVFGGMSPFWYRWMGRAGYPEHRWFYSEQALYTLLERAGLQVVCVKRFGLWPSTILSTVGRIMLGHRLPKPRDSSGRAAPPTGIYRLYGWLQYILRYRLGALLPCIGPRALFIAAQPCAGRSSE
jgi:SAM-dependent methyltransferase